MDLQEHFNHRRGRRSSAVGSAPNERRGFLHKFLGRVGKGALGFIPGVGPAIQLGLGALGTIQGAKQQGQANELDQRSIELAERDFESRQPFRDRLVASLDNPAQREDLGSLFQSENVFSQPDLGPIGPQQPQLGPGAQGLSPDDPRAVALTRDARGLMDAMRTADRPGERLGVIGGGMERLARIPGADQVTARTGGRSRGGASRRDERA